MGDLITFIKNIDIQYIFRFSNNSDFNSYINNIIKSIFKKLNNDDINIIFKITILIIDIISYKNNFKNTDIYYNHWKENNNKDIKSIIYLFLPFINDVEKNNGIDTIEDLNQLLISRKDKNSINENDLNMDKNTLLRTSNFLLYSNMSVGLIKNRQLNIYENNVKLIYDIIYHNIIGILETIEIMNGKYYVNWINIIPLNLENYKKSFIYEKTIILLNNFNSKITCETYILKNITLLVYPGLWLGDIYNIIRIKLYEECKQFKWLIFPYEINNNKLYLIHNLHNMIDIENILNNITKPYNDIFFNKINNIIENFKNDINTQIDIDTIKYYLLYAINNTELNDIKTKELIKFKLTSSEDDIDDEFNSNDIKSINAIRKTDIILCLEYILNSNNINKLWNYLIKIFNIFIFSMYGKYLIIKNEDDNLYKLSNLYNYKNYNINLKNIYNISKSLSHDSVNNWILLDKNYISLSRENKNKFFNKIYNHIESKDWIKINKTLEKQYINKKFDYNDTLNILLTEFKSVYITLIFEYLIYNGLLTEYVLCDHITNNKLLPSDTKMKQNKLKILLKQNFDNNINSWNESYYYLTNDKYKNLPIINKENKENKNIKQYTYFDLIADEQQWLLFYSLNYISQINFFKHYVFHQIMFITGATGQGKSTQVPKLLLYSLKLIDYKKDGKVICTAPRIDPLVNNCERIADELGVPIKNLDIENYYVQYKHKHDDHENKTTSNYIKLLTDGLLINYLINDITLFTKIDNKYVNHPIYDILFIDEAHEHNTNMDLILSLTKQTCYMNNKIRLMIVSATMNDDEIIYRNFYKQINDKLLFPIKYFSYDPILDKSITLNIQYMDRRYDISPPGETLQYSVQEFYNDNDKYYLSDKLSNEDKSIYAQNLCYEKAIEICNTDMKGNILLFSTGFFEIKNTVEKLNKNIPSNCIALPYYAQLNTRYKKIITEMNFKDIKNNKEDIYKEWGSNYIEKSNINSTYKYCIIVATNIAEASLTIKNLYYVIDNGYVKVNDYGNSRLKTTLVISQISESSKVQRKGRVGRNNNGCIYYMYGNDRSTQTINISYNITNDNVYTILLNMLCSKKIKDINIEDINNNNNLLISSLFNPNIYKRLDNQDENNIIYKSNLLEIYKDNYKTLEYSKYKQYFFTDEIDNSFKVFDTGQILENILDYNGTFYIIHPFEKNINRNILNEIIECINIPTNKLSMSLYRDFFIYLNNTYGVISIYNKFLLNIYQNVDYHKTIIKTNIFELSNKLYENLELPSIEFGISIIAASAMDCHIEIYLIITLLNLISFDIKNIKNDNISVNKFIKLYSYHKSDIIFLYNIILELNKNFKYIFNNLNNYNILLNDIEQNTDAIIKWSNNNNLNNIIILSFIKKLPDIYKKLDKYNKYIIESKKYKYNFMKHLTTFDIEEKIIRSFIYGNPLQYIIKRDIYTTHNYININKIDDYNNIITLADKNNDLLFYLYYDIIINTNIVKIKILSYVNINWLIAASPYTIEEIFKDSYIDEKDNIQVLIAYNEKKDFYLLNIKNNKNDRYNLFYSEDNEIMKTYYK